MEYEQMIWQVNIIMPDLLQLLGSKSLYDVQESIKFLLFLKKTNIESAEEGNNTLFYMLRNYKNAKSHME